MENVHRVYRQPLPENLKLISRTSGTSSRTFLRFSAAQVHLLSLVVCVLCFGGVSADVAPKKIVAYENETVTLPCRTNYTSDLLTVEWSKDGITPNITLLYRHGRETVEEKNPAFLNRTNLTLKEVKHGNISQVISKLRLSDGGRYLCRTMVGRERQIEALLELIVGAVSEPKLTFVPSDASGRLTLECKVNHWFPMPEIMFHDNKGNEMEAKHPQRDLGSAKVFHISRRMSLQTVTNSVTCSVHQPLLNQTKHATIYIPDNCMMSCTSSIAGSVLGTVVVLALCLVAYFLLKKYGSCFWRQKLPPPQQLANPNTNQQDQTGHVGNTELQEEIERLKLLISEKDEIIGKKTAEIEELKSKCSAAQQQGQPTTNPTSSLNGSHQVYQLLDDSNTSPAATSAGHEPKSGNVSKAKDSKPAVSRQNPLSVPTKKDRPKSTPALSTNNGSASSSSPSASTSKENDIHRSMSFSSSRPAAVKLPRRYSMSNPFSVLADLTEESESLIH
ncbi:CD276 antigen homolog [Anableps anableps]